MNFRIASYLILAALPLYGFRFPVLGQPTNALELLVTGVLATYVASKGKRLLYESLSHLLRSPAMLTLLTAATISLMVAPDAATGFVSFRQHILEPILFFWMLRREFRGPDDTRNLLTAACVPAIPIAVIAILQHYGLYPIPEGQYRIDHRSTSLYSYANAVGLYLAPLVAAVFAYLGVRRRTNLIMLGAAMLAIPAIIFAQTEAALLALVTTALIAGFSHQRTRRATLGVVFAGMLALALLPNLAEPVIGKLTLQDFSGAVRRTVWHETRAMLADHWLFGAGLAGYQTVMANYHMNPKIEIFWFPHTILLNLWVELGLLGLLAAALIARWVFLRACERRITWMTLAPLIVMVVHGLFDVPFFKPDLALLTAMFLAYESP